MNILMILSKIPSTFKTDIRVYSEAQALIEAGHTVTAIAWDRKHEDTSGDNVDGIRVVRIYTKGLMKLLPNDLFRNPLWWKKAYNKGVQLYQNEFHFDVVHCHDLDTLQTGVWLKKKYGCKLIYDAHEIFTYMIEGNVPNFVVRRASKMEKRLIHNVDHIITVDDSYATYFNGITRKPLTIVRNCKQLVGEYTPPTRKKFTLVYIGTLNKSRFFPQLLHVVGKINDIQLVIAAKKESIYDEIEQLSKRYANIDFLGTIPGNQVLPLTREGHVVICLFDPSSKMNRIGSPNKLFEAMVTGRPIIVTKGTNAGDIVEQEHCGLAIEYSEEKLAEAIKQLRDNPKLCEELGRNGIRAAKEKYNWDVQKKALLHVYATIQHPS